MSTQSKLPPLPEVGRDERFYIERIRIAERYRDRYALDAAKVGKYVTRALNYAQTWDEKQKCFAHAISHHCQAPIGSSGPVVAFYAQLAQVVRQHAGQEALRAASHMDDVWAAREAHGEPHAAIAKDAYAFFEHLAPHHHRPGWMNAEDYEELRILRKQWETAVHASGLV